ncbi:class I adenylate-forming enzyme family protein [Micromonospora sp. NPDC050397]|uniref:class I adenylate-forming enzyme family protein n=1 Tax=Micromonospora sp. NPDC050397 TaxID=3364279 RepID=UPI00384FF6DB
MAFVQQDSLVDLIRSSRGVVVVDHRGLGAEDMEDGARRAAAYLRARGVCRGDGVVLVDDGGGAELLMTLLGAWWLGARAMIVAATDDAREVDSAVAATDASVVVRGQPTGQGSEVAYRSVLTGSQPLTAAPECGPSDVALDIATSGTTGTRKYVSFTHGALLANVTGIAKRLSLTRQDRLYTPLPMSIAGVIGMLLLPGMLAGSSIHLGRLGGVRIAQSHRQLEATRPTLVYGVPYMYELLSGQSRSVDFDGLRWLICSSAPLPSSTFDRVWQRFGVPPRSSYCLAEAGTVTLNTSDDLEVVRNTVGEPLDGTTIRTEPADSASAGRIVVSGPSCGLGYRTGGQVDLFPSGEVWTRDLGMLERGLLTVAGRVDDVIQVAGTNVDLAHVRSVIGRCPGLGEFALVAADHGRLGRVPVLLVVAGTMSTTVRDVLHFCRTALRDVEVPREVRVVTEIPRTATGKARLREEYGR